MKVQEMAKALVGGLIAGLSVLAGAVGDGVSAQEWIAAAVAMLVGFEAVYWTDNAKRIPRADPGPPRDLDRGATNVVTVLVVVVLVVLVLVLIGRL
jgi:hypothetical protein